MSQASLGVLAGCSMRRARGRSRDPIWFALVIFVTFLVEPSRALAELDGGPDAHAVDVSMDAGDEDADVGADRQEYESLLAFAAARLGRLRSRDLFRVDLRNDGAVRRRLAEVDAELAAARRAAAPAFVARDGGVGDGGAAEGEALDRWLFESDASTGDFKRLLRMRSLELQRRVLAAPRDEREKLLAAEDDAVRAESAKREQESAEQKAERAEEAHLRALAAAQEAQTAVARQLAERRASLEATRGEQLRTSGRDAERGRELDVAEHLRAEAVTELARDLAKVVEGSPDADALYDRIVVTLVELRSSAVRLLGEIEQAPSVPHPELGRLPDTTTTEQATERDQLRALEAELEREATRLETEEREQSWDALRSIMKEETQVNDLRIALLEKVSASKRERILGFGSEGLAQGRREIARFQLELTWLRASSTEIARELYAELRRPAAVAERSLQLLAVLGIVWGAVFFRRRHSVWLRASRLAASRSIRRVSVLQLLQRAVNVLEAIGPELIALGAALLLRAVPGIDFRSGPPSVLYALILWFSIYRLALAITHRGFMWAAGNEDPIGREVLGRKILRSVRLVGRTAFSIAVLLAISAAVVGKGYLHALVVRVAWILGALVALILVRRWRDDIADAYLRVRPTGTLSRLVARTRDRWGGFFVSIAAFAVVSASAVIRAVRRFVLGFEQSRKALAYLFRRRLEKQVDQGLSIREPLPRELLAYFTEDPVADDELRVDRYPGLSEFDERSARWRTGDRVGPMLVVGRTGYGKSSWLIAARTRAADCDVRGIVVRERATTHAQVLRLFGRAFDAPNVTDIDELARHICTLGRSVVTVDDAQLLFLRGVGRLDGWRAFESLIEKTSSSVLWVVAFAHYPWEFLSWVLEGNHVFRAIVRLTPWSEAEITDLLQRRTFASSLSVAYDDLLIENVGPDVSTELITTARDYNRLIWDYAEGSPRVALHVWGASLVPDGPARARVRLFPTPDASVLELLSESTRLVLAAVVWHERLSLDEATAVTLAPAAVCRDAFDRLVESGVAQSEEGCFRICPRWWPVVVRYLRRKHLIET